MPDVTLTTLQGLKQSGEKIAMLTAYDATFAHVASQAGADVLLIGDSLGMVLQGHDSTLPVTIDDMAYHTAAVKRGNKGALILTDLPFESGSPPVQPPTLPKRSTGVHRPRSSTRSSAGARRQEQCGTPGRCVR